jgi:hypothetical protein
MIVVRVLIVELPVAPVGHLRQLQVLTPTTLVHRANLDASLTAWSGQPLFSGLLRVHGIFNAVFALGRVLI